jgi:hypothetical protein
VKYHSLSVLGGRMTSLENNANWTVILGAEPTKGDEIMTEKQVNSYILFSKS